MFRRFEKKHQRPIGRAAFARRILVHLGLSGLLVASALAIGMVGMKLTEPTLSWLDSYLNTAMLIGGMGQVDPPHTAAGKFFAGTFALYAGLVVILVTAVMLAPVVHRVMHRFHAETKTEKE